MKFLKLFSLIAVVAILTACSSDNEPEKTTGEKIAARYSELLFGTGDRLAASFSEMREKRRYRKLLMMVEACYSGGVMGQCEGIPGMLYITAAGADETSKADVFSSRLKAWMSNRFTSTFIEQIGENRGVAMRDLYYRLFINTVGSHVMVYNAGSYGNLYSSDMAEFICPGKSAKQL